MPGRGASGGLPTQRVVALQNLVAELPFRRLEMEMASAGRYDKDLPTQQGSQQGLQQEDPFPNNSPEDDSCPPLMVL